jgi:hypothetical protein
MTRGEKNRKLAEWLGWRQVAANLWNGPPGNPFAGTPPDFYTSEEASVLLLDKMPKVALWHMETPEAMTWRCHSNFDVADSWTQDADRKTAIAEAALKLIELEAKK